MSTCPGTTTASEYKDAKPRGQTKACRPGTVRAARGRAPSIKGSKRAKRGQEQGQGQDESQRNSLDCKPQGQVQGVAASDQGLGV